METLEKNDALGYDIKYYRKLCWDRGEEIDQLKAKIRNLHNIVNSNDIIIYKEKYYKLKCEHELLKVRYNKMFLKHKNGSALIAGSDLSVEETISFVCNFYGVEISNVRGKTRKPEYIRPRHILFFIFWNKDISLTNIGAVMGGRDHSTVIHGRNKIINMISDGEIDGAELAMVNSLQ